MPETMKVKLSGKSEKTATWIWLEGGQLKVEFYDFSETAQRMFGNDIACILTAHETDRPLSLSRQDAPSVILWIGEHFKSYFDIQRWMEENHIGFSADMDI